MGGKDRGDQTLNHTHDGSIHFQSPLQLLKRSIFPKNFQNPEQTENFYHPVQSRQPYKTNELIVVAVRLHFPRVNYLSVSCNVFFVLDTRQKVGYVLNW